MRVESTQASYVPHEIHSEFRTLSFERWWSEEIVISDSLRHQWTRKDLVAFAADQDGGSHVDPRIDQKYYQLAYQNSIGWKFFQGGESHGRDMDNPVPVSLWQIGIEFLKSLELSRRKNPTLI
ncbi:hypothetical protein B0E43_18800 [Algoriphagus sp. A40]|nr:hypothetical protein B0E43_18800 [Algoriphagus sp. A40]